MLPGFRFLFGAVILSVSLLIFALGAAALLRSAHDNFASQPNWRDSVEVASQFKTAPVPPSLAMLRVEPEAPRDATAIPNAEIAAPPPIAERVIGSSAAPVVEPPKTAESAGQPPAVAGAQSEPSQPAAEAPQGSSPPEVESAKTDMKQDKVAALAVAEEPNPAPSITMPPDLSPASEQQAPMVAATPAVEAALAIPPQEAPAPYSQQAIDPTGQKPAGSVTGDGSTDVAMRTEPVLPPSEIRLPKPRVDPEIMRARRLQRIIADRRAKARAAARRAAAARARAAQLGQVPQPTNDTFQITQPSLSQQKQR